jgi:hypothetical protein
MKSKHPPGEPKTLGNMRALGQYTQNRRAAERSNFPHL